MAEHGEVLGGTPEAIPTGILAKRDVQHPMQAILDPPVGAHGGPNPRGIGGQAGQLVPGLTGDRLADATFACDGDEPLQTLAIALPAGFDRFGVEVGQPARERTLPPPTAPDVVRYVPVTLPLAWWTATEIEAMAG